jgi:DNA-binding transcriptional regulator GbsR (MarR family)
MKETEKVQLTPVAKRFIVHWGEMGEKWGINRAVAQIHGLLYLSPGPLTADEIVKTLSLARSTVSVGLHELEGWGIVRVAHTLGDRKDHFEVRGDVYEMFRFIIDYRKRQEVDPTLQMLRQSVAELETGRKEEYTLRKMSEMLELFETLDSLYQQAQKIPTAKIARIARMSDVIGKLLKVFPAM